VGAAVLEITDDEVRVLSAGDGPGVTRPPRALVEAALEWIDDPVGLLDERPVAVADLWRSLVSGLAGERCDSVLIVHPPHWPHRRVARVVAAANAVADHVEAVPRDRWPSERALPGESADESLVADGAGQRRRPRRPMAAALVGSAVLAMILTALAVRAAPKPDETSWMTVVEGRMTVQIPANWTVERVTSGPGSRRLQVSPPGNPGIALHLTSSYAPEVTLDRAAEALTTAMADEPAGVFVDLCSPDEVAGRPAVTYREIRPGRVIAWSVVLDGATRIGIGCQSPPGGEAGVRAACEEAVRTGRET
jgi:type VII secretion-associated protein (TIGR03931 family)